MTVGSLRMMPCDRARRRACSPCRGRSRGREPRTWPLLGRSTPAWRPVFGRERAQSALELVDAVLHRVRPAVANQHDHDADRARERWRTTGKPRRVSYARPAGGLLDTGWMGCCSTAQSEPPAQCSCFQIGTDSFSVSMQNRAASNASLAVRRRDRDRDRRLRQRELADAVQQRDPLQIGPPARGLRRRSRPSRGAPAPRRPRRSSPAHRRGPRRDRARRRGRSRPRRPASSSPMKSTRLPAARRR